MNTVKSHAFGWGSLVVAAGVSFYFAKKSINERRREQYLSGSRPTEVLDWKARIEQEIADSAANVSATPSSSAPSNPGHDPSRKGKSL